MTEPAQPQDEKLEFRCNICGGSCAARLSELERESRTCHGCGSTVRQRSLVSLLSRELFGRSMAIPDFPRRHDVRGIGLSDWVELAARLSERLDFQSTYYHREPYLDITRLPDELVGRFDFLLSSDVFEHVVPPVSLAFVNARRLLRPGGVLILTVPFDHREDARTIEHFPDLHDFHIEKAGDGRTILRNRTQQGIEQVFEDLVFHGGGGLELEMRLFSRSDLLAELRAAGFAGARTAGEPDLEHGVWWAHPWSIPLVARA